jgi:hypothetical protein
MANNQESNSRRAAFDPSTTPRLQYPTFPPLSRSVEEWLSQSRPTMSTSPLQPERSSSALSESWATLSTSDIHSEDETRSEQTDVASLIDPNGPDDVASLDDRASSSYDDDNDADEDEVVDNYGVEEEDEDNDAESAISDSQMLPRPLFARDLDLPAVDDSGLTAKTALFHPSESIEFSEPEKWPEVQRVELKHTISILDDEETAILKEQLPTNLVDDCQLAITVQQTMTKQGLDLDKPFRVLYMGNPEFRNIILDKIGDVLVSSSTHSLGSSSTESSRYHVVPTSFGIGATPNYAELLPIHVQLIVDECVDAVSASRRTPNNSNITLHFKNRSSCTSVWTGSEHKIGSENEWTLPDLSIFLVSDKDSEANVRARHVAQSFMKTHGIPILIISEDPLWKKTGQRLFLFDHQGLHLCLESRRPLTGESVVVERYPIDVKTFESITPSQLNRHLASLSELYPKKQPSSSTTLPLAKSLESKLFYDAEKYPTASIFACSRRAPEFAPWLRLVMLSIVLAISVSLGYTIFRAIAIFLIQFYARFAMSSSSAASIGPSTTMTTALLPPVNSLTSLALKNQITDLTVSSMGDFSELSQLLTDQPTKNDGSFQFQVVGDCHLIIKQPVATKNNRFDIKVTRGSDSLSYELAKLFDGVYTLRLNREDAHGLVNVTVSFRSRQSQEQILEVDFGTPWLKIENWKRAAHTVSSQIRRDLDSAQTGLSDIYARLSTDVQVWMGDVVKKSHTIRQEAESLRVDDRQFKDGLDAIIRRSKEISTAVTRSTSHQLDVVSTALDKIHKQSIALNKQVRDIINTTRSFWGARSSDLQTLKTCIQDTIAMPSVPSSSNLLVRAQRSAKKLTEQNLGRFSKLLQRPRE